MPKLVYSSPSVIVEILHSPEMLWGPAMGVIDSIRTMNALHEMRQPKSPPALSWRWFSARGHSLPSSRAFHRDTITPGRRCADVVVIPGWSAQSGPHLDAQITATLSLAARLSKAYASGARMVCVSNGATLLGAAGLLDGQQVVMNWAYIPVFLRHSPGVILCTDQDWTQSERIWTCTAPVLATELFLKIFHGTPLESLAISTGQVLLRHPEKQQVAAQIVNDIQSRKMPAGSVERARRWLESHVSQPYDIAQLASVAATSPRTLLRHFMLSHGQTPMQYLQGLRIERARVMLETTYVPVEQISQACGYTDVGTFRRIFLKITGDLPGVYRETHRLRTTRRRWVGPQEISI